MVKRRPLIWGLSHVRMPAHVGNTGTLTKTYTTGDQAQRRSDLAHPKDLAVALMGLSGAIL